jgi:hypothetical protein
MIRYLLPTAHEVMGMSEAEYPVPPAVVGRGAVFVEHRLRIPQVSESAYIAPMSDVARRYARGLALHHQDHIVPDQRHQPAQEDGQ